MEICELLSDVEAFVRTAEKQPLVYRTLFTFRPKTWRSATLVVGPDQLASRDRDDLGN